jgi:serine-type D-Ala-D-Ala endopeptidase (penicillin-binding protein 7)
VRLNFQQMVNGLMALAVAVAMATFPSHSSQAATASKTNAAAKQKAKAHAKQAVKPGKKALAPRAAVSAKNSAKRGKSALAAKGVKGAKVAKSGKGARVAGNGLRLGKRGSSRLRTVYAPPKPSFGQAYGLHGTEDPLDLKSSVALVIDQDTNEVLFSKNPRAVLPIASITKLMTALVVTEAGQPLDEMLTVSQTDLDSTAGSGARSRLALGTQLSRGDMLHLSLMSSENRAAHVLGRTYPGGVPQLVVAMNRKARELGMASTRYVEPTGLSSDNQSTASDLAQLVRAALLHPIIRELSTSLGAVVPVGDKQLQYHNTNGLVRNPEWEIGLQKTGYITAAGRCLVMQAHMAGRTLIMVLLDSAGKYSRIGDAERIRRWMVGAPQMLEPALQLR